MLYCFSNSTPFRVLFTRQDNKELNMNFSLVFHSQLLFLSGKRNLFLLFRILNRVGPRREYLPQNTNNYLNIQQPVGYMAKVHFESVFEQH